MTLTALVIGFAVTAVLLALVFGVYRDRHSVDLDELSREEPQAPRTDREARRRGAETRSARRARRGHEEGVR